MKIWTRVTFGIHSNAILTASYRISRILCNQIELCVVCWEWRALRPLTVPFRHFSLVRLRKLNVVWLHSKQVFFIIVISTKFPLRFHIIHGVSSKYLWSNVLKGWILHSDNFWSAAQLRILRVHFYKYRIKSDEIRPKISGCTKLKTQLNWASIPIDK